jgi:hypothetical protein
LLSIIPYKVFEPIIEKTTFLQFIPIPLLCTSFCLLKVMSTSTEAPSAQPELVVAEDATKIPEDDDIAQTSMFVAEVASIINHEDINGILATQADMYVHK